MCIYWAYVYKVNTFLYRRVKCSFPSVIVQSTVGKIVFLKKCYQYRNYRAGTGLK